MEFLEEIFCFTNADNADKLETIGTCTQTMKKQSYVLHFYDPVKVKGELLCL